MVFISIALFLLSVISLGEGGEPIYPGSSLSPITEPSSWLSHSGKFAFGFYQQGDGFAVGIWLVGILEKTIVWTANRDDPPLASTTILQLTSDGDLVLSNEQGRQKKLIATNSTDPISYASMHDSGNFVLYDKIFYAIWKSFNHPTDTILGGQTLPVGGQLHSSLSETDRSTGRFHLTMQADGNLVLYPGNSENSPSDACWSSDSKTNDSRLWLRLYLNAGTGILALLKTTTRETHEAYAILNNNGEDREYEASCGDGTMIYRATVGVDGIFRLYSHAYDEATGKLQASDIIWSAMKHPCKVVRSGFTQWPQKSKATAQFMMIV